MFSKEQFGQRLCEIRKQHNETQFQLGDAIGLAKSRISEIENGKNSTPVENIAKICEHYKVSADYLLGFTDNPKPKGWKK